MGIELTKDQTKGLKKAKMWWSLQASQVFEIAGYAGTGKSTLVRILIDQIGIPSDSVKYATYTGKAALVLNRKGVPAVTIHKLCYAPFDEYVYDKDGKVVDVIKKWKKLDSLPSTIKLLVLDECSMISQEMWDDILSYDVPVIVLGDDGQLPPIEGESPLLKSPHVMLTEIMRQAEDNPIIHLSMLARQGKNIAYGRYGKKVLVLPKGQMTDKILKRTDIVLCGLNETRRDLNDYIRRELYGRESTLPEDGEKLICTKNNWKVALEGTALINGMIGYNQNSIDRASVDYVRGTFLMDFRPDFVVDNYFEGLKCDVACFDRKFRRVSDYTEDEYGNKGRYSDKLQKFDFGYAITVHKSQGSSFPKVSAIYEPFGDRTTRRKMLYTLITRAEDMLVLEKDPYVA